MRIQVLVAAMNQTDDKLLKTINVQTDAIMINQCDKVDYKKSIINGNVIEIYSTRERGLSKSRNMAIEKSNADICLLCDDDIYYFDGYKELVIESFNRIKDADIIIFNSEMKGRNESGKPIIRKIRKVPRYKTYSSVLIAFKREAIVSNNIKFNELFGTGSGMYNMAEDAIFLRDCYKKGLVAYTYPATIHRCYYGESTWFTGYNKKYFFDIGAYLAESFPKTKNIVKWYYPMRMIKLSDLSSLDIIRNIDDGIRGYQKKLNYNEYHDGKHDNV